MANRTAPPLDRAMLDSAANPVRVFFGILFLAWSWVSTVLILGRFLTPAISDAPLGIPGSYLAALAVALAVTGIEFVSAGRWPFVYWPIVFLLDMPFTAIQTHAWLVVLVSPYILPIGSEAVTPTVDIALWIVAGISGIIAAIFGELLLFGRRR